MCGFFVALNKAGGKLGEGEINLFRSTSQLINHRGPDSSGELVLENVFFSFHRLSIQDTSNAGQQPFVVENSNQVLVFNGEIYNFKELREDLVLKGIVFRSGSDTEVLFHLLRLHGVDAIQKLRGMFSFIFWDEIDRSLIVCRDRLGIKPLYFMETDRFYCFASEIKCLLHVGDKPAVENKKVSFRYLYRGFADETQQTFFEGISAIESGTFLLVKANSIKSQKYWSLSEVPTGEKDYVEEEFQQRFIEVVKSHLISDVPICFALSGGIDSSALLSTTIKKIDFPQRIRGYTTIPPQTFDEAEYVDDLVKRFGIEHVYVNCDLTADRALALIDKLIQVNDEPIQNASAIYHLLLRMQAAADGFKVLLVGEGADELLAGYRRMVLPYLVAVKSKISDSQFDTFTDGAARLLGQTKAQFKSTYQRFISEIECGQSGYDNQSMETLFDTEVVLRLGSENTFSMYPEFEISEPGSSFFDFLKAKLSTNNVPYVLRMEDRNSMLVGLESRVPFLDHEFVEFCLQHRLHNFMKGGTNKAMLRTSMKGVVPNKILGRKDKTNRPGSASHVVKNFIYEPLRIYLKSPNTDMSFFGAQVSFADQLDEDIKNGNSERSDFWFRLYIYFRWKELFFSNAQKTNPILESSSVALTLS